MAMKRKEKWLYLKDGSRFPRRGDNFEFVTKLRFSAGFLSLFRSLGRKP